MLNRSTLNTWINGNYSDLDKDDVLKIANYYYTAANWGYQEAEENINEDVEEE